MRRPVLIALALLIASLGWVAAARGAVTAVDLKTVDVVFDAGVTRPDADRQRLEQTARDLGAKGFRTKFAVVAGRVPDIDALANTLRKDLGESTVEAVLVLGPRQLGVDAKVFDCEKRLAFDAEGATLRANDIQGTINVANRLQAFHEAQVLRDADCKDVGGPTTKADDGPSVGLITILTVILLAGVIGFVFARRAAKRGEARQAADQQ